MLQKVGINNHLNLNFGVVVLLLFHHRFSSELISSLIVKGRTADLHGPHGTLSAPAVRPETRSAGHPRTGGTGTAGPRHRYRRRARIPGPGTEKTFRRLPHQRFSG